MKRLALLLFLAGCAPAGPATEAPAPSQARYPGASPAEVARAVVGTADVARRVAYLAGDAMRGRDTPSPELEQAARYLASEFQAMGLAPAGDDGYLQRWPMRRRVLDAEGVALAFEMDGARIALEYGADFAALGGGATTRSAVVFVGRGDDAAAAMPEAASGVAAVLLEGERPTDWRWPATVARAANAAAVAGVAAVMFVLEPAFGPDALADATHAFEAAGAGGGVPLFFVTHAVARRVFRAAGLDLNRMWTGRPPARPLPGVRASAVAHVREVDAAVPNVVALLPGSDRRRSDEYVILSAHYDHVGVGIPDAGGDSIYNGADDNASGTAALLEVAEAFAALDVRPARPVLFLALAGEEKGLLGSAWFAAHPTVPLTDAAANLNMDMIGRNAPGEVVVVGADYSSLGPLIDSLAVARRELGLTVVPDPHPQEHFFTRSDQYSFALRGIPSVLITAHLHGDYHAPSDEPSALDADKAARIARLVFLAALEVAEARVKPAWTEAGRAAVRRR